MQSFWTHSWMCLVVIFVPYFSLIFLQTFAADNLVLSDIGFGLFSAYMIVASLMAAFLVSFFALSMILCCCACFVVFHILGVCMVDDEYDDPVDSVCSVMAEESSVNPP